MSCEGIRMKGFFTAAGTVVLGTMNLTGKERLNLQQMAIVTPRTADALGLSYESLWEALVASVNAKTSETLPQHGSPIIVRISADVKLADAKQETKADTKPDPKAEAKKVAPMPTFGLAAVLPMEKATITEKNAFIRT